MKKTEQCEALRKAARHVVDVSELEFDNRGRPTLASLGLMHEAITALREALAEPDIEKMTLTQIAARHEQAEQSQLADASLEPVKHLRREDGRLTGMFMTKESK